MHRPAGNASLRYGLVLEEGGVIEQFLPPSFVDSASPVEMALAHMNVAHVDRALLTTGPTYGIHDDYHAQILRTWPDRFIALTLFKPALGTAAADDLERWIRDAGFAGLKLEIPETRRIWKTDVDLLGSTAVAIWERLNDLGGLFMIHPDPGTAQVSALETIVERYPRIRILLAHLGQPPNPGWKDQVRLAKHERIFLDCAALPWWFRSEGFPFVPAQEALAWASAEVGSEKILWGSDYPTLLLDATYSQLLDWVRNSELLTMEDKDNIFGNAASALFGSLPALTHA
jgi:L-galactono-1,5-lactonase